MHPSTALLLLLLATPAFAAPVQESVTGNTARVKRVLEIEEAIESLREPLSVLSRGVRNLALPDSRARPIFGEHVQVVDLKAPLEEEAEPTLELDARSVAWSTSEPALYGGASVALWKELLGEVDYFEIADFSTRKGRFASDDPAVFRADTAFRGRGRLDSGELAWVRARLGISWRKSVAGEAPVWRIQSFRTEELTVTTAPEPLFADVLPQALSREDHERATRSLRDETLVQWVEGLRSGHIELEASMEALLGSFADGSYRVAQSHVSVVDVDGDGWDDVFLVPGESAAMLFRNVGDGTFTDVAPEWGLALEGLEAACFGDFDNDADPDVFLSFYPSSTRYAENEGERFVLRPEAGEFPGTVLAFSTVDFDADGLLDVYMNRYNGLHIGSMAAALDRRRRGGEAVEPLFPGMDADESEELAARLGDDPDPFVDTPGPENRLYRNAGRGRFERAGAGGPVEVPYQTMAAVWSDFDLDGDADLYVVNEAGPNQLVRNDGAAASGGWRFTDVTDAATRDVGFGMGAAFGDYDGDGRPDLYVTNMYSKAGTRIAREMRSDSRIVQSARGNTLLRNGIDGFERVSGLEPPAVLVEAADFGWGAAFLDVDNDGWLDLYAPAGYVTMPEEVASVGDS